MAQNNGKMQLGFQFSVDIWLNYGLTRLEKIMPITLDYSE